LEQREVFGEIGLNIVDTVLSGHNALVLATGERGTGKSHTLFGSHSEPGLCLRVVEAVFARIGQLGGKSDWIVSHISLHLHFTRQVGVSLWEAVGARQYDLFEESGERGSGSVNVLVVSSLVQLIGALFVAYARSPNWASTQSDFTPKPNAHHSFFRAIFFNRRTGVGSSFTACDLAVPDFSLAPSALPLPFPRQTSASSTTSSSRPTDLELDVDLRGLEKFFRHQPFPSGSVLAGCVAAVAPAARVWVLHCLHARADPVFYEQYGRAWIAAAVKWCAQDAPIAQHTFPTWEHFVARPLPPRPAPAPDDTPVLGTIERQRHHAAATGRRSPSAMTPEEIVSFFEARAGTSSPHDHRHQVPFLYRPSPPTPPTPSPPPTNSPYQLPQPTHQPPTSL
jgi:hypothetical protein